MCLKFSFSFSQVECDEIIKEINNFKTNSGHRAQTFPEKVLRKTLGDFIFENFGSSFMKSFMKNLIITPVYKEGTKTSKDN